MAQKMNGTTEHDITKQNLDVTGYMLHHQIIQNKELIKKIEPVMQAKNYKRIKMVVTKTTATLIPW